MKKETKQNIGWMLISILISFLLGVIIGQYLIRLTDCIY